MRIFFYGFILFSGLLIGCHQLPARSYLLQHPDELAAELSRCQKNSSFNESYCDMVKQSSLAWATFEVAQSGDPERFGQLILEAQERLDKLGAIVEKYRADPGRLHEAQKAYQEQLQKVESLLAVVEAMMGGLR
jgi:DNA repair ATPase RecN